MCVCVSACAHADHHNGPLTTTMQKAEVYLEVGKPAEVRACQVHLAEHTGLLIRDACWVHTTRVLWGKQHPALSEKDPVRENT